MIGNFIDNLFFSIKNKGFSEREDMYYMDTDYGRIRVFDTKENKPTIINVPDGPNVIEHQFELLKSLSKNYRVICFEYPGIGFSYPNSKFNYSFDSGAKLLFQIMDSLKIEKASLVFSCANGFYALKAASVLPERIKHIFIAQTASIDSMLKWTEKAIPTMLKLPIIGQCANLLMEKKLAHIWYRYSLPKESTIREEFRLKAKEALKTGGCFCLSSLVQGITKEKNTLLNVENAKVTLIWGSKDFTHRKTEKESILQNVPSCEIIEFKKSGHFPELEQVKEFTRLVQERIN